MHKTKAATILIMFLNIVLLLALIVALFQVSTSKKNFSLAGSGALSAQSAVGEDVLPMQQAQSPELEDFILNMKTLADKHNVNALFLQELFPNQIVYKFRGGTIYADVDQSLPMHNYKWEHLSQHENGTLTYAEPGGQSSIFGIDVSKHQGEIDWQKVKDAGVQYVILRVGYRGYDTGAIKLDEFFEQNIQGASAVGLPIGVYFFSQAANVAEAEEEAAFVLDAISNYQITWPVVFDMEEIEAASYRTQHLAPGQVTDIAIAFCEKIKAAGHKPMIYGNVSWFLSLTELSRLNSYDKWFAQYRSLPWYPYSFTMWQYSHTGKIDGIVGEVDMNLSFVDYALAH